MVKTSAPSWLAISARLMLWSALALAPLTIGCTKESPAPEPATTPTQKATSSSTQADLPQAATSLTPKQESESDRRASAEAEAASYIQRRKPRPTIIGGCEERCQSPEGAVDLLIERLRDKNRVEALYTLFDWSLLVVDGKPLGSRWAKMWGSTVNQPQREAEILAWLRDWSAFADHLRSPEALDRTRATGLRIEPFPKRSDVCVITWRHPELTSPRGERFWRIDLTRRGWEWLISRIDHRPSVTARRAPPPRGSSAPGRL